jgi:hypothetical protein
MIRIKALTLVAALFVLATNDHAIAGIKILTPGSDSCLAYTNAMDTGAPLNAWLSGWAIGFFDGEAQGAGIDYLRSYDIKSLSIRLYESCHSQPDKLFSLAAQELATTMITEQGLMLTKQ